MTTTTPRGPAPPVLAAPSAQRDLLPVEVLRPDVLAHLPKQPMVIAAPTGSGKSTRVPVWCAEATGHPVLVIEPRRVACRSLARWVAQGMDQPLGRTVGYTVRFEDITSPQTQVRFVTPGIALNYAASGTLDRFPTIILDEFHERGLDVDLCLAICRRMGRRAGLLLMSATVGADALARALGGVSLRSDGRMHPVAVHYLGGPMVPTIKSLPERIGEAVRRALHETDGNVLVFLPGKGEIHDAEGVVKGLPGVEVLPLHGELPNEAQDRAFDPGGRKVILATNVAETSITLPAVTAVVDSGLVRQRTHRAGRPALLMLPISQASADQRKGRAGRVAPGICYRLWDNRAKLEPETPPEILREDLRRFVLSVGAAGYRPQDLEFLDAPPVFAVAKAQAELSAWGALSESGALTDFGRLVFNTPVDPTYGKLIVGAPPEMRRDLIDLVAALESRGPLMQTPDGLPAPLAARALAAREMDLLSTRCDATRLVMIVRRGDPRKHCLDAPALAEVRRIADQLREQFALPSLAQDSSKARPDRLALVGYFLRHWPGCAYVRREKGHGWGNGQDEVWISEDSAIEPSAWTAVALEKEAIELRNGKVQLKVSSAMACVPSDLVAAGLGLRQPLKPVEEDGRLVAEVVVTYAGRQISRERQVLEGTLLREAVADAIAAGERFPGLWDRLQDRATAHALQQSLEGRAAKLLDARSWLVERLQRLGLEQSEDLELVAPEDLGFDGLDDAALARLNKLYPRTFGHYGARYTVHYEPDQKRVTLKWAGGAPGVKVAPGALPAWPGWSVRVEERGKAQYVRE